MNNRTVRIILRLATMVLSISVVIVIFAGGFWYTWQHSQGNTPQIEYNITARKLERTALGLYLRSQGSEVTSPIDPDSDREVTFAIESGENVMTIAQQLEHAGLISDAELFRRLVQYWGADEGMQTGVYLLKPSMTMEEIMLELQHGRVATTTVTIPEGWRIEEIATLLEEKDVVPAEEFIRQAKISHMDHRFLQDRPPETPDSLEGFLFPDTYHFPKDVTVQRVIEIMVNNWDERVPEALRRQADHVNLSLYEAVTLASIIEREAVVPEERSLMASVYLNRLEEGMRLQADPTVQYAKGYDEKTGRWWSSMTREEFNAVDSAYNTYLNTGLPPGPICNPGLPSLRAVLEPESSDYLFFLARGDGSHVFAKTYEEHLRNEERYGGE